jgi:hypothetical protein
MLQNRKMFKVNGFKNIRKNKSKELMFLRSFDIKVKE